MAGMTARAKVDPSPGTSSARQGVFRPWRRPAARAFLGGSDDDPRGGAQVDFEASPKATEYHGRLQDFMSSHVFPAEAAYQRHREVHWQDNTLPPIVEELKAEAHARGLWNLFLPDVAGLSNVEYAPLAELTGWSMHLAPEAINCAAPDTGNMEVLQLFGSAEQQLRWLTPLLDGEIRSGFAMTEPDVASSDATNIATSIVQDGDDYVINGRKWWTSGAADPRCAVLVVMGKTDPTAPTYRQQSMVLVPMDTAGVELVRTLRAGKRAGRVPALREVPTPVESGRELIQHGLHSAPASRSQARNISGKRGPSSFTVHTVRHAAEPAASRSTDRDPARRTSLVRPSASPPRADSE